MARKKKIETVEYFCDAKKWALTKGTYIDQMKHFLEENIKPSCEISKEGSTLSISVPVDVNKRMIKLRITKFMYNSGFKDEFRLVSTNNENINGFKIIER